MNSATATKAPELSASASKAVLVQTERLLSSSHFKASRRYTDFLRYVVIQTLSGHGDTLKERTLGVEIFERSPTFDTGADSIVRVTAAEVRKRIAQYYQEEGHERELRIDLPPGAYVPQFRLLPNHRAAVDTAVDADVETHVLPEVPPAALTQEVVAGATGLGKLRPAITIVILTVVIFSIVWGFRTWVASATEQRDLLQPLWGSKQEAIICVGSPLLAQNQPGTGDPAVETALGQPTANNTLLPFSDAMAIARFQGLMYVHGKSSRVQLARIIEAGEAWHEAGRGRYRQVAIDDFIAAAEWLAGWNAPQPRLVGAFGGSNGGLLVAAAMTQRPGLFQAVLCIAPLLDMVRHEHFDQARKWRQEYGTVEDAEEFASLYGYSPYHRIQDGVNYPATLFITGDRDDRCNPAHVRKMAARLQSHPAQTSLVVVDYSAERGHSPVLPLSGI